MPNQGSYDRGLLQTVNWKLVACYVALVLFGWVNIYASVHSSDPSSIFDWGCRSGKQFIWILTSFGLAAAILFAISPKVWEAFSVPAYIFVLGLLVLVIFVSNDVKGSHSWFELGPIKFQPAEISKITTSLLLAMEMSKPTFKISLFRYLLLAAFIVGVPMLVIVAESETGSALVYIGFIFVLYREGLSGWFIGFIGIAVVLFILTLMTTWWISAIVLLVICTAYATVTMKQSARESMMIRRRIILRTIAAFAAGMAFIYAADFIFDEVLQPHQKARIEVLLGMKEDPAGVGYNVRQSKIAIGSGGLIGKGFLNGTQTTFGFVPEQSTDFIFCTVGEEWGFLGCTAVIAVYALMIFWILQDADSSRANFTRIYGYCLASCLFMHLFINIGMTLGLMPVIGIPLPFLSYGGSSLWAFTTMLFIFIALCRQDKKYF